MNTNGRPRIDYTSKDYASLREAMLALAREKLPDWTDHSPNDLGVLLVELFASMGDAFFHYLDWLANESYLETALERRSVVNLLRLIGYELRPSRPASADLTLLFEHDATGTVVIQTGAEFQTTAKATGKPVSFQYVREPLTVNLDPLKATAHTDGKQYQFYEDLPVLQVDATVSGEILGSSDGGPGQRYALARAPLIDESLIVSVDEGPGPQVWERRRNLLHSTSGDRHYVVRRDEEDKAWAEFGHRYGKAPARGRDNILASYRVGGGAKGNVAPHTISKAVTPIEHLKLVFNRKAASGGTEPEDSREGADRGPQLFRAMGRAVTARDYEAHAREFGVGKARARAAGWNVIELFVAPAGGGYPSHTLKDDLRAYMEDKRIITSILEVKDPIYVRVCISGRLEVEPYVFADQVRQRVQDAVRRLLAFENVEFEDKLYLSKVYEAIEAIEGVRQVYICRFAKAAEELPVPGIPVLPAVPMPPEPICPETPELPNDGTLSFGWNQIPIAGYDEGIRLEVTGGQGAG